MAKVQFNPMTGTPTEKTKHLQAKVLAMYRDHPNFTEIARELGYSLTYILKLYRQALKSIIFDSVDNYRRVELERLNKIHHECMRIVESFHPVVNSGSVVRDIREDAEGNPIINETTQNPVTYRLEDIGPRLSAIDRMLRAADRRAKLLGLDAPVKTAMTDPNGEKEASFVQFYLPNNGRDSHPQD